MRFNGLRVFSQKSLALNLVIAAAISLVGDQRHLGINDDVFVIGQANDYIRLPATAAVVSKADLCFVFMAFA